MYSEWQGDATSSPPFLYWGWGIGCIMAKTSTTQRVMGTLWISRYRKVGGGGGRKRSQMEEKGEKTTEEGRPMV